MNQSMEELGARRAVSQKNEGQEILGGSPCEHHWTKDPREKGLARDLSRSVREVWTS